MIAQRLISELLQTLKETNVNKEKGFSFFTLVLVVVLSVQGVAILGRPRDLSGKRARFLPDETHLNLIVLTRTRHSFLHHLNNSLSSVVRDHHVTAGDVTKFTRNADERLIQGNHNFLVGVGKRKLSDLELYLSLIFVIFDCNRA